MLLLSIGTACKFRPSVVVFIIFNFNYLFCSLCLCPLSILFFVYQHHAAGTVLLMMLIILALVSFCAYVCVHPAQISLKVTSASRMVSGISWAKDLVTYCSIIFHSYSYITQKSLDHSVLNVLHNKIWCLDIHTVFVGWGVRSTGNCSRFSNTRLLLTPRGQLQSIAHTHTHTPST